MDKTGFFGQWMDGVAEQPRVGREKGVRSCEKHVVANILKMASVLVPRPCWRYVIGRTLTLDFGQNRHAFRTAWRPRFKRLEQFQAVGLWVDVHDHIVGVMN